MQLLIERTEQVPMNKVNNRVIHFITTKSTTPLETQGRIILVAIQAKAPMFRHQLIMAVAPHIKSTKTISQVVSFWLTKLKKYGCIRVQSFEDFQKELERGEQK